MRGNRSRARSSLVVAVLLGGLALAVPAHGRPADALYQPGAQGSVAWSASGESTQALLGYLRTQDFEVTQGYPMLYTQADCDNFTYPIARNCYGNNPASPYVVPVVKSWPDEYVDPATVNLLGRTRPGYSATYRLDPREAIVIFGQMPPPGRYFGLQSYVFSKQDSWTEQTYDSYQAKAGDLIHYLFEAVPPGTDSGRIQSFSSLSNSVNNVVIGRASGAAFGRLRYFVITPDQKMDQAVRAALARLGVPDENVFTEPVPPADKFGSIGPLGLDRYADDFLTAIRYAMPDNEHAANAWLHSLPLTVLRVREDPASPRVAQPFPAFVADQRSAQPEAGYAGALKDLVRQVCQRWGQPCDPDNLDPSRLGQLIDLMNQLGQFGPYCRAIGMNCLGDGQDASYFFARARLLERGTVYAVLGTLATETGNATYVGLSVNDMSKLKGVANVPDRDLKGSASAYAATVPDADKFFVHYFARDCAAIENLTDGACTTITEDMVPLAGDETAQGDPALRGKMALAIRAYLQPGQLRGPDPTQQLKPWIVTFTAP
jgi:hypothetical protein